MTFSSPQTPISKVKLKQRLVASVVFAWFFFIIFAVSSIEPPRLESTFATDRFFIAANFYNNEEVLPIWTSEMLKVIDYLGASRVFVSIFENGSKDRTKEILIDFKHTLSEKGIENSIVLDEMPARDRRRDRIEFMAFIRNQALKPLRSGFTKILFFNDVIFDHRDIVDLVVTSQGTDMACALDFYGTFYDRWVTRDVNGEMFESLYPYVREGVGRQKLRRAENLEVYSCWNGVTIFSAEPFVKHGLRFRGNLPNFDCYHSECLLICKDFRELGYNKIILNPRVKVAYNVGRYIMQHYLMSWVNPLFLGLWNQPRSSPTLGVAAADAFPPIECWN